MITTVNSIVSCTIVIIIVLLALTATIVVQHLAKSLLLLYHRFDSAIFGHLQSSSSKSSSNQKVLASGESNFLGPKSPLGKIVFNSLLGNSLAWE